MPNTANLSVRIDPELKAQAESLFSDLGMSLTTAITVFFRQAVRENRIPFEIRRDRPTRETAAAMQEALRISRDPDIQGYKDPKELLRDLNDCACSTLSRQRHNSSGITGRPSGRAGTCGLWTK